MSFLKKLFIEEDGQDMVEYGLVIALVVIVTAAALTALKGNISTGLSAVGASVSASL
jgi:pilus assembly protein Flp/PilA